MNALLPPADRTPPEGRTIVLVGLMGVGKSSVGRRLATALGLPFKDVDTEVEIAAGMPIPEIFSKFGEPAFRDVERRVISRLLDMPAHILATGGGAFMDSETRERVRQKAISVWLQADFDVLARRLGRREGRPLLKDRDPVEVLTEQAAIRYPHFEEADLKVRTGDQPHQEAVDAIIRALQSVPARQST